VSASAAVFTAARHHHGLCRNITPVEGKRPTLRNWTTRRANLEEIEAELAGRATGFGFVGGVSNSNIVPLDFDSELGEAWWRSQCKAAGIDPDDWPTVITPGKKLKNGGQRRPGRHRYVHDVRGTLTNAAGRLKDLGIDVRGRGQVLMPPSPHPDGGIYEWVKNQSLDDFPDGIPPCPSFIYDAITGDRDDNKAGGDGADSKAQSGSPSDDARIAGHCKAALARTSAELATAAAGSRNTALNTSALKLGHLAPYGTFTEAEARAALHGACVANGLIRDDGEQAFAATFSSGWTKGTADPRDIPADKRHQRRSTQRDSNGALTGCNGTVLQMEDFLAYMPEHKYIFRPTGQLWVGASVNARLPPVPAGLDENGKEKFIPATRVLDQEAPVEQITWAPGEPEQIRGRLLNEGGWIERKGVTAYNLFRPGIIVPRRGDAGSWLKHVAMLYPDAAEHIVTWLAHKVQRPAEKINHAIVLGGQQGIGKDTILEPIKHAIGAWNFQDVSPGQVLGRFNGHLKSIILRISEARDLGDANRFKLYDHLKAIIAAPPDTLRVDEKNLREYAIPNVVGVIITTNHKVGGIYLSPDDRRHFVAWATLTREMFAPDYFPGLYRWYADGGIEIVADYLGTLDISKFNPKAPPPQTETFWQMVNSSRAPEAAEMADRLEALGNPVVVTLDELRVGAPADLMLWLCDRKNSRAILHRLEDCGYEAVRNPDATDGLWRVSGKRQVVYGKRDLSLQEKLETIRGLR
jgi:hypothetical protein